MGFINEEHASVTFLERDDLGQGGDVSASLKDTLGDDEVAADFGIRFLLGA